MKHVKDMLLNKPSTEMSKNKKKRKIKIKHERNNNKKSYNNKKINEKRCYI